MTTFTIDTENNITAHATAAQAKAIKDSERFGDEAGLAKLAATWPTARLVEIYNSLTGVTPVKKFKDRSTATTRIWSALKNLDVPITIETGAEKEVETADHRARVFGSPPYGYHCRRRVAQRRAARGSRYQGDHPHKEGAQGPKRIQGSPQGHQDHNDSGTPKTRRRCQPQHHHGRNELASA